MKTAFYYILRVKLIRFIKNGKIDFISEEKEFKDENPIIAREKALSYYENYIDTILGENIPHSKAKKLLAKRISKSVIEINDEKLEIKDMHSGIGVFMKVEKPINDDKKGDEYLIHGIGFSFSGDQSLMDNLNFEMEYYKHYNYDTKNYLTEIEFYEADDNETNIERILRTPNDWKENKKLIKQAKKIDENDEETSIDIVDLLKAVIENGETNNVEFKSSLFSFINNYGEIGYSRHIKFNIAKTIASFLNSNGGLLFVGVKDDKTILGLETDFSLASANNKDDKKDYFRLEVDKIIKEYFKSSASQIKGDFINIDGIIIYVFQVQPSKKPIFIMNKTHKNEDYHKKEFYVRLTGASSILYSEIDDIVNYCLDHWCKD